MKESTEAVTVRLDADVVHWFKRNGKGFSAPQCDFAAGDGAKWAEGGLSELIMVSPEFLVTNRNPKAHPELPQIRK